MDRTMMQEEYLERRSEFLGRSPTLEMKRIFRMICELSDDALIEFDILYGALCDAVITNENNKGVRGLGKSGAFELAAKLLMYLAKQKRVNSLSEVMKGELK